MARDSDYAFGAGRAHGDSPGKAAAKNSLPSTHDYRGPVTDTFPSGKATHAVMSPKGEAARTYKQEAPNGLSQREAVSRDVAPKGFSHGSAAHGGPQLNKQGLSSGGPIPRGGEGAGK